LPHHTPAVVGLTRGDDRGIELVRLPAAGGERAVEAYAEGTLFSSRWPELTRMPDDTDATSA
jgi:hypothetical protein